MTESRQPDLTPCPFCGGSTITIVFESNRYSEAAAICEDCQATGPLEDNPDDARKAWNRRASAELPEAQEHKLRYQRRRRTFYFNELDRAVEGLQKLIDDARWVDVSSEDSDDD